MTELELNRLFQGIYANNEDLIRVSPTNNFTVSFQVSVSTDPIKDCYEMKNLISKKNPLVSHRKITSAFRKFHEKNLDDLKVVENLCATVYYLDANNNVFEIDALPLTAQIQNSLIGVLKDQLNFEKINAE